ncbi:MAG: hypothetical protein ACE5PT_06675 [Gemmatimonadales bacterium]
MLHQRDYILRMIEQIGLILIELRRRILSRTVNAAAVDVELRKSLQQIGLDIDIIRLADGATLERIVAPTGELDVTRGWFAAEALYLDGLQAELEGREPDARLSFAKALRLFRLFDPRVPLHTSFPEAADRIREIEERLGRM